MIVSSAIFTPTDKRGGLRYLDSARVAIEGQPCDGMVIRAATGKILGRLHGFVVDPVVRQTRYLVIRTTGLFGRTRLVPLDAARVDVENRAIEVPVDERETRAAGMFPSLETVIPSLAAVQ